MGKVFIPIVLGTARDERKSSVVANFLASHIGMHEEIETELVDVSDYDYSKTTPPWGKGGADEKPTKWKETADRADGFIIVVPEYNRGYPGELKLLLDSLHDSYNRKPALLCGVSAGIFGGRAVVDHMRPVLSELKMVPVRGGIYVGKVKDAFDADGNPTDEAFSGRVDKSVEELLWFTKALKAARE